MTRTPRSSAFAISSRTKSSGSSRRRTPLRARERQPAFADDRQQDAALSDLVVDHRGEVVAAMDVVEIHERLIVAEARGQHIEEAARVAAAVVAPVADEDSGHGCRGKAPAGLKACTTSETSETR